MKKILIGVVAIAIVIVGGYFVFSKKAVVPVVNEQLNSLATTTAAVEDISNWNIYRNEELKFEFKYPPAWTLLGERSPIRTQKAVSFSLRKSSADPILLFSISGFPTNEMQNAPSDRQIFRKLGENGNYTFLAFSPDHYSIDNTGVKELDVILS